MIVFPLAALAALLVVAGLTPLVRSLAVRWGWVDRPDGERKRHAGTVPRVGGLAIAAGVGVGLGVLALAAPSDVLAAEARDGIPVLVGGAILVALGLWDDVRGIGFKRRFLIQVAVAYGLLALGWRFDVSALPFLDGADPFVHALVTIPLTLLWVVGLVNAFNLIDGMDGLASGLALIAFGCMGIAFVGTGDGIAFGLCAVGAAASAGFLLHNRHPATVFMGDCGSTLLGFLLAMAGIRGVGARPDALMLLVPLVAVGVPVLDTTATMTRRMLDGKSPFLPDADHVHHRAFAKTGSVPRTVQTLWMVGFAFGAFAVGLSSSVAWVRWLSLGASIVAAYGLLRQLRYFRVRVAFAMARREVRRLQAERRYAQRRQTLPLDPDDHQGDGADSTASDPVAVTASRT